MLNVIKLFINSVFYFESKTILKNIKIKRINILILKICLFFILSSLIFFIPLLITVNTIPVVIGYLVISLIFSVLIILRIKMKSRNIEDLDKNIINNSVFKVDFINFLKNDIYFNIKFSFFVFISCFLFQVIIYSFFLFLPGLLSIKLYFIFIISYFIFLLFITYLFFIVFYLINRDKKSIFSKISDSGMFKFRFRIFRETDFRAAKQNFVNNFKNVNFKEKLLNVFKLLKITRIICLTGILILFIVFLIVISNFYPVTLKIGVYLSVIIFSLLFINLLINIAMRMVSNKNLLKPYYFTIFVFSIIFFIIAISPLKITLLENEQFSTEGSILFNIKMFIQPVFDIFNNFCYSVKKFIDSAGFFVSALLFAIINLFYLLNVVLNSFFAYLGKLNDYLLRKKLTKKNPAILFGDSLSLYPVLFRSLWQFIIIIFLLVEIKPLSIFFYNFFKTFKVTEVFDFDFLNNEQNIIMFFKIIIFFLIGLIIIKLLHYFFSSVLSHFILFNDEIVYYENKIYKKTVLRIPLTSINYIVTKQNLVERIFDIGTVFIETSDKNGLIRIKGVSSIEDKNILIMDKIKSDL